MDSPRIVDGSSFNHRYLKIEKANIEYRTGNSEPQK